MTYDRHSLIIDGRHRYIWSGEFHYWRLPSPGAWRDVLQKMRAEGYDTVSIYFDWAYHSSAPGRYDFTGIRDIDQLLRMAEETGLYVIARPGPYINAETDSGGFPGWVETQKGLARSSSPDFLNAARDWYRHVDAIIARHQYRAGHGSVILYQIENEYIGKTTDRAYMAALERQARVDGIRVPFTHNSCCGDGGRWSSGLGAVDINGYDSYPQGFDCTHPDKWDVYDPVGEFADTRKALGPTKPFFLTEYQGGSADLWGGPGYDACRTLTDSSFERVFEEFNLAAGASLQNFYMAYGGTSWGWLPSAEAVYTSYDYGAGIDESRALSAKFNEQKLLGNEIRTLAPLVTAQAERAPQIANRAVHIDARRDDATRTQFFIVRHANIVATTPLRAAFNARVDGRPYTIPIELNGRDSKLIVAGFALGTHRLVYTTSEIMSAQHIGDNDVAVLFGRDGERGETLLHFTHEPRVSIAAGTPASSSWNAATGDLRLVYEHGPLARIGIETDEPGQRPLQLLIGSDAVAAAFWPQTVGRQSLLIRGPYLVRSVAATGPDTLDLSGDSNAATDIEVFAPPSITHLTWNGASLETTVTGDGTLRAEIAGPQTVVAPPLSGWKRQAGAPETGSSFDDRGWKRADHLATNNPNRPLMSPVLYADDYGYHYGDVWYRGRFVAGRVPKFVAIDAGTGRGGIFAVWINGTFIGSKIADTDGRARTSLTIPRGTIRRGAPVTVAILLENMGHNEDFGHTDTHKNVRGIRALHFDAPATKPSIDWRIVGNREIDAVRGALNSGGQFGERSGWYLPGFDDSHWLPATVPSVRKGAGITWYRTRFALHVPAGHDIELGLRIDDTPARPYRALIYLNGWLIGRFVNDLGPQTRFVIPPGIVHLDAINTIAISSLNLDPSGGDLGTVSLEVLNNVTSTLVVPSVASPTYHDIFGRRQSR